jgi:hypothetical protein
VSLRIFGDELEPESVSALLGGNPTHSHRKDEVVDGDALPAATGAWVLETSLSDSAEIEEYVAELFSKLTTDLDEWATLSSQFAVDVRCELEVGESSDGFDLSPRLAAALAERGVVLSFAVVATA